jgi:hypothetical protein
MVSEEGFVIDEYDIVEGIILGLLEKIKETAKSQPGRLVVQLRFELRPFQI